MDSERFEAEVIELASEGTPLTLANVAARTKLPLRKVEAMLDELLQAGHLDVEAHDGAIVYRVKGLSPGAAKKPRRVVAERDVFDDARDHAIRAAGEVMVKQAASRAKAAVLAKPREGEKSYAWGAGLGLIFPPAALFYAAPWVNAFVGTAVYLVLTVLFAKILPLMGLLMMVNVVGMFAGIGYVWRYNKEGRRAPILPDDEKKRLQK